MKHIHSLSLEVSIWMWYDLPIIVTKSLILAVLQWEIFTLDNADACLKISNAGSAGSSPLSCGLDAKGGTLRALKYLSEHAGCFLPLFSVENPATDWSLLTKLKQLPHVPSPSQSSFAMTRLRSGHFSPWTYPVAVRQSSQHKWHHLWPWYRFQQQAPCWYVLRCFSVQ